MTQLLLTNGADLSMLIMLPLMGVAIWFFMMRPESKKRKQAAKMRDELIVGDEITTAGGIIGRVINIKDDELTIETGKSQMKIRRWAVASIVEKISE